MTTWNNKRKTYHIGIDTGRNTGIAIWCSNDKKLVDVKTVKVHTAMDIVRQYAHGHDVTVWVEDARLRKWIPRQVNEKAERGRREGAGYVKRDATLWEDALTDWGVPFKMVAPRNNKTKTSKEEFQKLTKYTGITSSHARDAAFLVIGR